MYTLAKIFRNSNFEGALKGILISLFSLICFQEHLGPFCFLIFMGILAVAGIFIYLFLPETKGKSIVEITLAFDKLNYKQKVFPTENSFPNATVFCTRLWLCNCIITSRGNGWNFRSSLPLLKSEALALIEVSFLLFLLQMLQMLEP